MKNTGITYTSAERSPVILPEMAELLPPLSAEQSAALEEDLLRNGCYSPIIVNEDMVIVDGHNRQSLCEKHTTYDVQRASFLSTHDIKNYRYRCVWRKAKRINRFRAFSSPDFFF